MGRQLGLYIHIPFCKSKCDYCDFYSLPEREARMDAYQKALLAHLKETAPQAKGYLVDTVYFGGGTPSFYGEKRLRELLSAVKKRFEVAGNAEISLEANPDSVDKKSMVRLRRAGVNRVSLGMQSAHDDELEALHRAHTWQQTRQAVAAIREAGGPDLGIIIELHALTDTTTAVQLGRELAELGCFYYEEPTQPLDAELFKEINAKVPIPLATGERVYTRWGYRPFLEDRSIAIIQPDLCNCGGLSEGKKICDMAHTYDVGVQIHICGGPISTAAALQLEAVIPNFLIHEQHHNALLKENIDMCTHDYQPKDGYFEIPDLPGIGNEVTEETIRSSKVVTVK